MPGPDAPATRAVALPVRIVRSRPAAYALAILTTGLSALMRWVLPGALASAPYLSFYPAVVVSAALGGVGPGIASTFLSLIVVNFVLGHFDLQSEGAVLRQVIWIVASVGVSLLAGMQRTARLQRDRLAAQRQLALDAARTGFWRFDVATGAGGYDERCAELLGLSGRDIPPEKLLALVHPGDLERFQAEAAGALEPAGRGRFSGEYRFLLPDGALRWFEVHGLATFAGLGQFRRALAILGTLSDVTLRKQAEEALRRHELVVQQSRDIILFMRRDDGRILEANPAAVAAYGYSRDELLARTVHDLRAIGTRPSIDGQMAAAAQGGVLFESVHQRRDGSTFPVEVSSRGVTVDGTPTLVSVVRDITDRKRAGEALQAANERLREADRAKDEFLGMLSHELRNPLAPIRNAIYILRRVASDSEQARRAQGVIERQAEHLTRLVDDLLDVTRIARGKIELRTARVDLVEVLARAADDFAEELQQRGVAFRRELPAASVWAQADATRVTQIVGNLLHNAAKFTPEGGEVALKMTASDGEAEIRVRDTGAGIEAALLPRVFEAFVQGERTLARTEGGLGLGLALVKGLAELHGGKVRAESAGRGHGAEFVVRLPVAAPGPARARSGTAEPGVGTRRRVLVVDDNVDGAETLADLARMLGHEVEVAFDGPSALENARARPPDVVLCDIGLPGMSGYDVARALRASGRDDLLIFAASGYAQPEDVVRAIEAGFDGHLAKPCDPSQIERLLG